MPRQITTTYYSNQEAAEKLSLTTEQFKELAETVTEAEYISDSAIWTEQAIWHLQEVMRIAQSLPKAK